LSLRKSPILIWLVVLGFISLHCHGSDPQNYEPIEIFNFAPYDITVELVFAQRITSYFGDEVELSEVNSQPLTLSALTRTKCHIEKILKKMDDYNGRQLDDYFMTVASLRVRLADRYIMIANYENPLSVPDRKFYVTYDSIPAQDEKVKTWHF